ncbi:MAG: hypothetical protein HN778_11255 [Prolixibacteraceae bacterium]|jgi:hypothetical protein|nr:hypothetical protein [Prolixibacteraceae bacterium]MBT6006584.1 hypothetical protein [Prolixibacteraceae bacterium]MBT6763607.1 hypothetical protein [Prolixibacteraceae bacterium]MBT7000354.1 hypothetical protein [Prolixibacteraceae bacterium]MBT7395400.1 hypothetical protein [Prolixibacteraceae bacterium]
MNDNDKNLKDMWKSAEYYMGATEYDSTSIERFLSSRSKSIAGKFIKMMKMDIGTKLVIVLILVADIFFYLQVQNLISFICVGALVLIIPLIIFEFNILKQFEDISERASNTNDKFSGMMTFLRRRSFVTLLSTASTYLFGYNAALLLYFYAAYGELRRMGSLDIFVFPTICLLGIVIIVAQNSTTIKHQLKHIELCLSDLNEEILPMISRNIEAKQKADHRTNILVAFVVLLAFLFFVVVLNELGF